MRRIKQKKKKEKYLCFLPETASFVASAKYCVIAKTIGITILVTQIHATYKISKMPCVYHGGNVFFSFNFDFICRSNLFALHILAELGIRLNAMHLLGCGFVIGFRLFRSDMRLSVFNGRC